MGGDMEVEKCDGWTEQIKELAIRCKRCGKQNQLGALFCSECGSSLKKRNWSYTVVCSVICLGLVLGTALVAAHRNSLKSPIEGLSKKVYDQGLEYLEKMDADEVEDAIIAYAGSHKGEQLNKVYVHAGIDFDLDLGKKSTDEEQYYAKLIRKFWESKAICYAHKAIMGEYQDYDETAVQMATTLYKGIVSGFEDGIDEAEKELKEASDLSDMENAYRILDEIWESEE